MRSMPRRLRYTFNWIGSVFHDVIADRDLTPGHHLVVAELAAQGASTDRDLPGTAGVLTLYIELPFGPVSGRRSNDSSAAPEALRRPATRLLGGGR